MNFTSNEIAVLLMALEERINKCAHRAESNDDSKYWLNAKEAAQAIYNKIESGQEGEGK